MSTRFPPFIASGTLTAGTGKTDQLLTAIHNHLMATTCSQSPGVSAWEAYDNVSGGGFDKIYRSKGDQSISSSLGSEWNGDARVFIRLTSGSTGVSIRKYDDWSNVQQLGGRVSSTDTITINDVNQLQFWIYANEYFLSMMLSQSTSKLVSGVGELARKFVSPSNRGRFFISGTSLTSGSNVSISTDRDLTNPQSNIGALQVSGTIQLFSITPSGSGLSANNQQIAKLISVSSTGVMIQTLPSSSAVPMIVGSTCQPSAIIINGITYNAGRSTSAIAGSSTQQTPLLRNTLEFDTPSAEVSPQAASALWHGTMISLRNDTAGHEGVFGQFYHERLVGGTSFSQGDLFYDVRTGYYYEIFGDWATQFTNYKVMFPYTGSDTGRTVFSGVVENDFNITFQSPNQGGTFRLPSGGRLRDIQFYDFEAPSSSFASQVVCDDVSVSSNIYSSNYVIGQLSSSIRQTNLTNGCIPAQAPFSLFSRGSTRGLRLRTDPYTAIIGPISATGTFFPIGRS